MARLNSNLHESLTDDILKLLFAKKVYTVTNFLEFETKTLTKITNLTYKETLDIRNEILTKYSAETETGLSLYHKLLKSTILIATNVKNFDLLLDGGLLSGNIYELCGHTASGKTQLCLTITLNIAQNFAKTVYFLDTKRDFSAKKLQNILESRDITEELSAEILNRIKVKQINSNFELISALYDIKTELINGLACPLIIIDSLPAIFYNLGDFNCMLSAINHFVNILRFLSVNYHIAVIVTNIMLKEHDSEGNEVQKPGLGTFWANIPNTRLLLTKNQDVYGVEVIKSTSISCNKKCTFNISNSGVN